jgi:protein SCO1/2
MKGRWKLGFLAGLLALGSGGPAKAAPKDGPEHCHGEATAATPTRGDRTLAGYQIPDVELVRSDGTRVKARREIDEGHPVVLNFIFTTCTTICPVASQTFAQVQSKLGEVRSRVRMVSISIDPEQDTPERLRAYARKFGAQGQWSFYTGSPEASVALQKAFDAYRGNKMNHLPVTFVRAAPGKPWVRLEGLANSDAVLRELRQLLASR